MKHLPLLLAAALICVAAPLAASDKRSNQVTNKTTHINPPNMMSSPAFSQAVKVKAGTDLLFIGGQNSVDATGKIVAPGDLKGQTIQALKNVTMILESEGLKLSNVVKWNIHIVQGSPVKDGYEAFQQVWDKRAKPPAITVVVVSSFGNPEYLVEIDAVAAY